MAAQSRKKCKAYMSQHSRVLRRQLADSSSSIHDKGVYIVSQIYNSFSFAYYVLNILILLSADASSSHTAIPTNGHSRKSIANIYFSCLFSAICIRTHFVPYN